MRLTIILVTMLFATTAFSQGKQRQRPGPDQQEQQPQQAQQTPAQSKPTTTPEDTIRIDTNLVSMELKLTDAKGKSKPVAGLKPTDFIVYENGVKQKIAEISSTETPFNVVLLIDTSGSTAEQIQMIRNASLQFIKKLRPDDRIAIVQFNKEPYLITDFTSDRGAIDQALNQFQRGPATAFYDTLQFAFDDLLQKVEGRKAVVALTDGVDSYGYNTYSEALPIIEKSGAGFYFLEIDSEAATEAGMMRDCKDNAHFEFSVKQFRKYYEDYLHQPFDQSKYEDHCTIGKMERKEINKRLFELSRQEMREMANKSGGHSYPVKELSKLDSMFSQIADELGKQYSLSYYPTNEKRDGSYRTIKIEVKRPGYKVIAKPGYRL